MKQITIPDPQRLEMNALDDAFHEWCLDTQKDDPETVEILSEEWTAIDRNALVYTQDDLAEAYDPEFGYEAVDLAMERNMYDRIKAKRNIIHYINEGDFDA